MTRGPGGRARATHLWRAIGVTGLAVLAFPRATWGGTPWSTLVVEDPAAARTTLENEVARARAHGDPHVLAAALISLSDARIELSDLDGATRSAEEAIAVSQGSADFPHEVFARIVRGDVDFYHGEFGAARRSYEEALALGREHSLRAGEAAALKSLGIARKYQGEFEESIDDLEAARQIFVEQGDAAGEVSALMNLGGAYVFLGDLGRGLDAYLPALEMARGLDEWHVHHVLMRMGLLYLTAGFPEEALPVLEEASEIAERRGLTLQRPWVLFSLSRALMALGRRDEAMAIARRALSISENLSGAGRSARYAEMGWLHLEPDPERTLEWARRALAEESDPADGERWHLHVLMADALGRLGRLDEAIARYREAVAAIESIRSSIAGEGFRSTYLEKHVDVYQRLVAALVQRWERSGEEADAAAAFEALERGRARMLLESLGGATGPAEPAPTATSVGRALEPGEAFLSYMAASDGLLALVVTADRVLPVRLPGDGRALARRVENYLQLLSGGEEEAARLVAARLAREILHPLLPDLPAGADHLIIAPDGALHRVPFETLPLPGTEADASEATPLVLDRYAVSYVPSAAAMVRLDRNAAGVADTRRDLLMLAAPLLPASLHDGGTAGGTSRGSLDVYAGEGLRIPALPYSAREAESLRRIVSRGSEIDLGASAGEARLKRLLPEEFRIVHVAAHGLVSTRRPDRSALVLSASPAGPTDAPEDGLLHAFEIRKLHLDCDLVVLSACQTARGRMVGGEGEQGLARAFMVSGARSVLASLWSVEDAPTASFMESFYLGLASGLPPAQALRRAKLAMRRSQPGLSARDWAAFVLIGHGDAPIRLEGRPWWDLHSRAARAAFAVAGPGALLGGGLILGTALRLRAANQRLRVRSAR